MASTKSLFLRKVPTGLIREAKAAAAHRGVTLTTLITEALSRSLSVHSTTQAPASDLQQDMAWYRENRAKLLRRYKGEYIAIIDGVVVDHGRDFNEVGTRVFARFGNRNIFMPLVQAEDEVVRVRSPRVVKP
jgi:hypothetical protein